MSDPNQPTNLYGIQGAWADRSRIAGRWKRPVESRNYSRWHPDYIVRECRVFIRPIRHWPLWVMLEGKQQ